ncbi:MAG: von Willebrand factor type A domain-containing protein [Crocinitomicaceae bacterium]
MKTKNILLQLGFTLLTFMFLVAGNAQQNVGSVKGLVTEKTSKSTLAGALVKIINEKDKKYIKSVKTNPDGTYHIKDVPVGSYALSVTFNGYEKFRKPGIKVEAGKVTTENVALLRQAVKEEPIQVLESVDSEKAYDLSPVEDKSYNSSGSKKTKTYRTYAPSSTSPGYYIGNNGGGEVDPNHNTESYASVNENGFRSSKDEPLSTFSVDVDAASYSNTRRFILAGQKPEKGAVRVEEMINYFNYDYPDPTDEHPFSITTEVGDCPWSKNKLVHIGLQGKRIEKKDLPPSNLVFLLDVSGSMDAPNKLPLLKKSFRLLVDELGPKDRISMVVYAGAAGLVLKPTAADNSTAILEALNNLKAGGSTAGGAGIALAYQVAQENFIEGGNNRVILATDGDFNIGMSSDAAMQELIEEKRKTGIFLTCLGFGTGNYKDSKMEILADKGNGNYAYIDNLLEAKKVLVTEIGATLITLAKDVKIQVEFNPEVVESYRLVGYENRLLNNEDFNDDTKDAGEIGAGHSVTALYEVVLKGQGDGTSSTSVDPLKYQTTEARGTYGHEMLTVKFRYKKPDGDKSILLDRILENKITPNNKLSRDFNFSAAVAEFGMLLIDSPHKGTATFDHARELAKNNQGSDKNGYREEFIHLVAAAKELYK